MLQFLRYSRAPELAEAVVEDVTETMKTLNAGIGREEAYSICLVGLWQTSLEAEKGPLWTIGLLKEGSPLILG